jgi:hypothetical protein
MSASKKIVAGKASGVKRTKLTTMRRFFVLAAYEQLLPKYRNQPYSLEALDALEKEFRSPTRDDYTFSVTNTGKLGPRTGSARRPASERLAAMLDDVVPLLIEETAVLARKASRETLIKDLKALGIKSKRRDKRSG